MPDRQRNVLDRITRCCWAGLLLLSAVPVATQDITPPVQGQTVASDVPAEAADLDVPADGFIDAAVSGYTRILPGEPPRALRHIDGGVELYLPETDTPLRRFTPAQPVTTWAHARGDRWWIALAGGEVVEVDFDARTVSPAVRFDGDVHWLGLVREGVTSHVRLAVAEHSIEGVGSFTLLYTLDSEEGIATATTLEMDFDRVFADEYRRAWLLPEPGERLSALHYIDLESHAVVSFEVPNDELIGRKRFGGTLSIPDGPLLVWGFTEGSRGPQISWVAELAPPYFDDAPWQEVPTFRTIGLPLARESDDLLSARIQHGAVSLRYRANTEMLQFRDEAAEVGWMALPTMGAWVDDREWPSLYLRGHDALPEEIAGIQLSAVLQGLAEPVPLGAPETYLEQLLARPLRRAGRLDPERETDRLFEAMLRDVRWRGAGWGPRRTRREVHISAESRDGWLVGLNTGQIVTLAPGTGRFEEVAQVDGIPTSIERREHEGGAQIFVDFWRFYDLDGGLFQMVFEYSQFTDRWLRQPTRPIEIEDKNPYIWTDRRVAELRPAGRQRSVVNWIDLTIDMPIQTIDRDDALDLAGLLELPDGRVVGYGTDRLEDDNGPVLVDVTRGRDGIVWSRSMGHLCEQSPLPAGGFTHAAYIASAGRLLLVADGKVWSTGLGFGDWRQELRALPAGAGEAGVEGAGDVD